MLLPGLYLSAVLLAALSGAPGLIARERGARVATWMLAAAALCGLTVAGAVLFGGMTWTLDVRWALPGAHFLFRGDALGAFLLAPVTVVPAALAWYGESYWSDAAHAHTAPKLRLFFGLTVAAMIVLVSAANALLFLFAWEIMAVLGFLMVTTSDQDQEVREAGWIYLVAAHTGTLCLFAGFSLLAAAAGGTFDLGALPLGFAHSGAGTAAFLLIVAGFGVKAGLGPLHWWLPVAHAAAPSHVSALLSGLVLKMGILGLLRLIAWTPDPPLWWGGALMGLGALSGILAMASALGQLDLKRMLAYSSIENISIVVMGLGLALAGKSLGSGAVMLLGGGGALLHLLNHALFKPLLFMGAGSIMHGTGTRDMERLGGLAKAMPRTSDLFLTGSAAICGLPPLNGFVSEFLIYMAAFHALTFERWPWGLVVVGALALIGTLAVAGFTRAFGTVFLGEPRTVLAAHAHESPKGMLRPMALLASLCALLGLAPIVLLPALDAAARALGQAPELSIGKLANLGALSLVAGVGLAAAWAVWHRIRFAPFHRSGTWDCGFKAPTARIQYTATSFTQMLTDAFRFLLVPSERRPRIQGLFPRPSRYQASTPDLLLDRALKPSAGLSARTMALLKFLQGGHLPIYLLYVVVMLIALFAWTLA